jgi:hypothetical protein
MMINTAKSVIDCILHVDYFLNNEHFNFLKILGHFLRLIFLIYESGSSEGTEL